MDVQEGILKRPSGESNNAERFVVFINEYLENHNVPEECIQEEIKNGIKSAWDSGYITLDEAMLLYREFGIVEF